MSVCIVSRYDDDDDDDDDDNNDADDKEDEVRRVMKIFHDFMIESLYVCVFVKKNEKKVEFFFGWNFCTRRSQAISYLFWKVFWRKSLKVAKSASGLRLKSEMCSHTASGGRLHYGTLTI